MAPMPLPEPTPCPECGGARVTAEGVNTIRFVRPGTRLPGLTGPAIEVSALICERCGFVSLYAKEPGRLSRD